MVQEYYMGLGHVAIHTVSIEDSLAFYEKLGGKLYQRDSIARPDGELKLALVDLAGFRLELLEPPEGAVIPSGEGAIPHFAIYVNDLDAAVAEMKQAGVASFRTAEKTVRPDTFGGLQNWFLTGPSGEVTELLQIL